MGIPFSAQTRQVIRQAIGYKLGSVIVSTASAGGSTITLVDANGLARGGTQDYVGRQVIMISGTAGNKGKTSWVQAFIAPSNTLSLSPPLPAPTAKDDGYELWETYIIQQINDLINQGIRDACDDMLKDIVDDTIEKVADTYQYDAPEDFVAIHTIDYEYDADKGIWRMLSPDDWWIVGGDEPQIELSEFAYDLIPEGALLRVQGYRLPVELIADSEVSEIDSDYIVLKTVGQLLASVAQRGDPEDALARSDRFLTLAEERKRQHRTSLAPNTRFI